MSLNYQQPQIFQNLSTTKVVAGTTEANFQDQKSNLPGRNFGLHVGDDHLKVIENYNDLKKTLLGQTDLPHIVPHQTHSKNVLVITKDVTIETYYDDFDAVITNVDNLLIGVLSADCVPILLYDSKQQVIAAVHAGRAGALESILPKTIQKMGKAFGSLSENLQIALGPSIHGCCYEVNEMIASECMAKGYASALRREDEKVFLDVNTILLKQLNELNIGNIEVCDHCTSCRCDEYFSYRADAQHTGRIAGVIILR